MILNDIPAASLTRGILDTLGQNGAVVLAKAVQELNEEGMNAFGNILLEAGEVQSSQTCS